MKKTPEKLRQQLIDVLQKEICPVLKFRKYGYTYPFEFITLNSRDVTAMVVDLHTSTDLFGRLINDFRKEFFMQNSERALVDHLWNAFWWPAVDKVWPLQCFQLPACGDEGKNDHDDAVNRLYLLARTGPDEWIGLTTFINYAPIE